MNGTVDANGAVTVRIRLGEKGANGTGRLSGTTGSGTWHGAAANDTAPGAGKPSGARVRYRDHTLTQSAARLFASGALDTPCAASAAPAA